MTALLSNRPSISMKLLQHNSTIVNMFLSTFQGMRQCSITSCKSNSAQASSQITPISIPYTKYKVGNAKAGTVTMKMSTLSSRTTANVYILPATVWSMCQKNGVMEIMSSLTLHDTAVTTAKCYRKE